MQSLVVIFLLLAIKNPSRIHVEIREGLLLYAWFNSKSDYLLMNFLFKRILVHKA